MRILIAAAVVSLLASDAAADTWTAADSACQGAVYATLAVDLVQTRQIVRDYGYDRNPLIGDGSWQLPPVPYFATVAALHTIAMVALPQPYRRIAQGATVGMQLTAIGLNWHAGYALEF